MRKNSTQQSTTTDPTETGRDVIKIADMAIRDDWQVRNKIDPHTVSRYRTIYKNGGSLPPIEVARVDGAFRLVDGWHRLAALRLLERDDVEANITTMTMSEARWAAAAANLSHGLPLKSKELRNVFGAYITARRHYKPNGRLKSYRDMEADLNGLVTYRTLNRWMEKDHPVIAREMSMQHGGENKGHYRDGGPPTPPHITPLEAARASLDGALAEARALSAEDRRELLDHGKRLLRRLEGLTQWTPEEIAQGRDKEIENSDF